jgi:hypothetical protein
MTKAGRVDVAGESAAGEFDDGGSALVESATGESTTACAGAEVDVSASLSFLVAMTCCDTARRNCP